MAYSTSLYRLNQPIRYVHLFSPAIWRCCMEDRSDKWALWFAMSPKFDRLHRSAVSFSFVALHSWPWTYPGPRFCVWCLPPINNRFANNAFEEVLPLRRFFFWTPPFDVRSLCESKGEKHLWKPERWDTTYLTRNTWWFRMLLQFGPLETDGISPATHAPTWSPAHDWIPLRGVALQMLL